MDMRWPLSLILLLALGFLVLGIVTQNWLAVVVFGALLGTLTVLALYVSGGFDKQQ